MLFRKKMERSCGYCTHCTKLDDEKALCTKKGIVSLDGSCMGFHYDPIKRIPKKAKALDFKKYDQEDYSL